VTGRLLQAELLKLRTTRTFLALVGSAAALGLLVAALTGSLVKDPTGDDLRNIVAADTSALFILVLGIVGGAGEWRHRTIAGTLLSTPDRRAVVVAKALAYAAAGVVLSLAATIVVTVVAMVILSGRGEPTIGAADFVDVLWRNLVRAAFYGAIGAAIGTLVRNQPTAIVGVLVVLFIVEPTLGALAPKVERFGPISGAPSGLLGTDSGDDVLAPGAALLVMLGWAGLLGVAAAESLARRDVT
jgi:ABC-2 type transport system permease protein